MPIRWESAGLLIREAIRKLELEGLVVMVPRKGAEVAHISGKNLRDVLEVRRALEELAGELACERMTAEDFKKLEQANLKFASVLDSDDITVLGQADEEFHGLIYQATDNDRLVQMVNHLREQMYRYRIEHLKNKSQRTILLQEHPGYHAGTGGERCGSRAEGNPGPILTNRKRRSQR